MISRLRSLRILCVLCDEEGAAYSATYNQPLAGKLPESSGIDRGRSSSLRVGVHRNESVPEDQLSWKAETWSMTADVEVLRSFTASGVPIGALKARPLTAFFQFRKQ
jgi:hypothetical protein